MNEEHDSDFNYLTKCDVNYYCEEFRITECKDLIMLYFNAQSLRNKLDDIELLILEIENNIKHKIHIIAISEIWIYENENRIYNLDNFNSFISNRQSDRSGGCLLFIREEFDVTVCKNIEFEKSNFLLVRLNRENINVACIYRYNETQVENFVDKFEEEILSVKNTVILGDININLQKNSNGVNLYKDIILANGFNLINSNDSKYYTRKRDDTNSRTTIDHVITDLLHRKFEMSLFHTAISDHRAILVGMNSPIYRDTNTHKEITIFDYNKFENDRVIHNLTNIDTFSEFHDKLKKYVQKYTKTIIPSRNKVKKHWANEELIELIKQRDKFYKLIKKNGNNENYKKMFAEYKVKARNFTNYLKKNHYGNIIEKNAHDNKKIWNVLNNLIYNKDEKRTIKISKLCDNDEVISDQQQIANALNEYFVNVVEHPPNITLPERNNYEITQNFELNPCTIEEIEIIIKRLNPNSSNGYDNISAKLIQKYSNEFARPLQKYINECFETGSFPKELKIGCVIPVYKKGEKSKSSNYRPITKLSVIDKIFEEAILNRLKVFLAHNEIIDERQFGFVEKSNTTAACLQCIEQVRELTEKKLYIAIGSIDLTKAFDSVNLECLVGRLEELGIYGNKLKIFKEFLMNRKQFTQVNEYKSGINTVKSGVPQGSKLASNLFLIFINGIFKLNLKCLSQFYADDGLFIFKASSFEELIRDIEHDMRLISNWFEENYLKLNISKTKILIIDNHRDIPNIETFTGIDFQNEKIDRVTCLNYLGLAIDQDLNWNEHIDNVKKKIVPMGFAINRIKNIVPKKYLYTLYHAHVMSHLAYLNPIWNRGAEYKLDKLQRIQNKIIKSIEKLPRLTPTATLYIEKPNVRQFSAIQTILLVQKIKKKMIKSKIEFENINQIQYYPLRNLMNFRLNFFRTERGKKSIQSHGLTQYNKLPIEIRNEDNFRTFKKNVTMYIIKNPSKFIKL